MSHLLEVEDLHVAFRTPSSIVRAVRGVSFTIDKGETLAIVGESGSGKTVTGLSVPQLLPYGTAFHERGSIRLDGQELVGASAGKLQNLRGSRIGLIFQEPMTSLNPLHPIARQIGESLQLHRGLTGRPARERVLELLRLVGLDSAESRLNAYPHQLSGGQRQRVMIAMALANEPDLLIADEPTTALDATIQAQILALLADLRDRLDMALLLITHDLGVVAKAADRVAVMNDGEIVEQGTIDAVLQHPQHLYTRHLVASEPSGTPAPYDPAGETVVETRDLKVHFPITRGILRRTVDYLRAVDGVSATLKRGQTIGVVGESGSGKTTFGLALLRLIESKGPVVFLGRDIQGWKPGDIRPMRRHMQVVFQDPYGSLSPRLIVEEIVGEGLGLHRPELGVEDRRTEVARALAEVGLEPGLLDRLPHELSGGQRQRVSIARAMILDPEFVVLDEPTSALDLSVQAQIVDLLRGLQAKHRTAFLFISHDMKVVRALSHHVIVMRTGKVVEQGPSEEVFERPQDPYTKALLAAAFRLETA
ncbi:MAG: ABC transporter ATP-binding protein [Gammaproteobacteria bacterium]|nr:ABC transporter ATP-binding protein [Gammaproteobacteria bacterium]MDH4253293.1 ABC transporter ATP-binding protein [Gammaproteobacteria bacterium]